MATNFKEGEEGINEINITPFVDVVLVLLVIFMVTAPVMIQESLKVNLPKSLSSDISSKVTNVGIGITKEGQIIFSGNVIEFSTLSTKLQEIKKISPETNFLITADVDSRHGDLIRVIDLLKRNGLGRFALQVEKVRDSK
jgi:biopolymer transport protein ExbD